MNPPPRDPLDAHDRDLVARCLRGRVIVIDDDLDILDAFSRLISLEGYACETYPGARAYLQVLDCNRPLHAGPVCVLCDVKMPEMDGLQLQARLRQYGEVPMLLMSGSSGAEEAVGGFRAGALDFLIKPIDAGQLLESIGKALAVSRERQSASSRREAVAARVGTLSARELAVARLVAVGVTNLGVSLELGISERTVKFHRQRLMAKLGIAGTPELVRLLQEFDAV